MERDAGSNNSVCTAWELVSIYKHTIQFIAVPVIFPSLYLQIKKKNHEVVCHHQLEF